MDPLVRSAQRGDMKAFEQLVRTWEKQVYNMAFSACGSREDAADISQEVFLRLYRALPGFRGDSSFSTWLHRIVANICLDFLRKKARMREEPLIILREDGSEALCDLPDVRYSPETELEKRQLREAVNRALLTLTPEHRMIVVLRELEGLTYEEIAEALSLEAGTVKSRLARARAQLRLRLAEEGNFFVSGASKQTNEAAGGETETPVGAASREKKGNALRPVMKVAAREGREGHD